MADSNSIADAMSEFLRLRYPELLNRASNSSTPPDRAPSPPGTPAATHNPLTATPRPSFAADPTPTPLQQHINSHQPSSQAPPIVPFAGFSLTSGLGRTVSQSTVAPGMEVYAGTSGRSNVVGTRHTPYLRPADSLAQNVNRDRLQSSAAATASRGNRAGAERRGGRRGAAINPPALLVPALPRPSTLTVVGVLYPNRASAHLSNVQICAHTVATILQLEFPPEHPSHWVLHRKRKDAFLVHAARLGRLVSLRHIPYSMPLVEVARRVVASLEAEPVQSSFLAPEVPNGLVVQALVVRNRGISSSPGGPSTLAEYVISGDDTAELLVSGGSRYSGQLANNRAEMYDAGGEQAYILRLFPTSKTTSNLPDIIQVPDRRNHHCSGVRLLQNFTTDEESEVRDADGIPWDDPSLCIRTLCPVDQLRVQSVESANITGSVDPFPASTPDTPFPSRWPLPPPAPRMWITHSFSFDFNADCADSTVPRTESLLEAVEGAFHHAEAVGVLTPGRTHDLRLSAQGMPSLVALLKAKIEGAFEIGTCASLLQPANRIVVALQGGAGPAAFGEGVLRECIQTLVEELLELQTVPTLDDRVVFRPLRPLADVQGRPPNIQARQAAYTLGVALGLHFLWGNLAHLRQEFLTTHAPQFVNIVDIWRREPRLRAPLQQHQLLSALTTYFGQTNAPRMGEQSDALDEWRFLRLSMLGGEISPQHPEISSFCEGLGLNSGSFNLLNVINGFLGGPEEFFHHHATALIRSYSNLSPFIEVNEPSEVMLAELSVLTGGAHATFASLLTAFFTAKGIPIPEHPSLGVLSLDQLEMRDEASFRSQVFYRSATGRDLLDGARVAVNIIDSRQQGDNNLPPTILADSERTGTVAWQVCSSDVTIPGNFILKCLRTGEIGSDVTEPSSPIDPAFGVRAVHQWLFVQVVRGKAEGFGGLM